MKKGRKGGIIDVNVLFYLIDNLMINTFWKKFQSNRPRTFVEYLGFLREARLSKALLEISLALLGIEIVIKEEHPKNAFSNFRDVVWNGDRF